MASSRNTLANKGVDVDVDVAIQLDDEMETNDRPTHPFNPDSMYTLNCSSTSPFSFPVPNAVPNALLLSPAQIKRTITNTSGKRSQNDDRTSKVRVVEQEFHNSRSLFQYFEIYFMGFYRERLEGGMMPSLRK